MWLRPLAADLMVVAHFVGLLVIGIGLAMSVPLLTGLVYGELAAALDYLLGMGFALSVGTLLLNAKPNPDRVTHTHALAITALGWLAAAAVAAVPLAFSGHYPTYLDAAFDAISGLTVSGLTVAEDLDHMALTHNMWRHLTQFI
ncbi:MAG: TrkH family potassium uptake protein, partial [Coriobacteriia bacterium]|nr:TrkH family potassium uptake protein [Coriobacteriia bacterium]